MQTPYIIKFFRVAESRGNLTVGEVNKELPFTPQRVYWMELKGDGQTRGNHANISSSRILVPLSGQVTVTMETVSGEEESFCLENDKEGVFIPPMYWHTVHAAVPTLLLCISPMVYDESDYIRDYEAFKQMDTDR